MAPKKGNGKKGGGVKRDKAPEVRSATRITPLGRLHARLRDAAARLPPAGRRHGVCLRQHRFRRRVRVR